MTNAIIFLTKTTTNMAVRRNLDLEIVETSTGTHELWFYTGDDCEPSLMYRIDREGLTFKATLDLPYHIKEELPAHIMNEAKLREVITFIANELQSF